jgi:hypothetical protein
MKLLRHNCNRRSRRLREPATRRSRTFLPSPGTGMSDPNRALARCQRQSEVNLRSADQEWCRVSRHVNKDETTRKEFLSRIRPLRGEEVTSVTDEGSRVILRGHCPNCDADRNAEVLAEDTVEEDDKPSGIWFRSSYSIPDVLDAIGGTSGASNYALRIGIGTSTRIQGRHL